MPWPPAERSPAALAAPMPPVDALLPAEMAERAEGIGVAKASLDAPRLFMLAVLAGAFIALGGVFATTALAGTGTSPWGPVRVLAGVAFSVGLVLVVVGGAELFTGNALIVMAWASGRVSTSAVLRNWGIVYAGNLAGAVAIALAVCLAGSQRGGDGAYGIAAFAIARAKLQLGFGQAIVLGVLGNVLVCLAVWLSYSARTTTDRLLAVVLPISAFVAAGFEHSIANMYFVPFAILVAAVDPDFVTAHGLGLQLVALTWSAFLGRNLLPVTFGNIVGGAGLVGAVYWFVYLRPRRGAAA
jgi:formate transporter